MQSDLKGNLKPPNASRKAVFFSCNYRLHFSFVKKLLDSPHPMNTTMTTTKINKLLTQLLTLIATAALTFGALDSFALSNSKDSFSDLSGTNLSDLSPISIKLDPQNKGTVLVFISARCPCSASHEAIIKNLSESFKDFQFIGIHSNADEPAAEASEHFKKANFNFPVVHDIKNKISDLYGALKTPHVYVFNNKGNLAYDGGITNSHVGPSADKNYLKEVLEDLNNNKKPRYIKERSLGCYIQRQEPS